MVCSTRVSRPGTAANASPAVKTTAPRSTISFNKNWPGKAESPGKPTVGSHSRGRKKKTQGSEKHPHRDKACDAGNARPYLPKRNPDTQSDLDHPQEIRDGASPRR